MLLSIWNFLLLAVAIALSFQVSLVNGQCESISGGWSYFHLSVSFLSFRSELRYMRWNCLLRLLDRLLSHWNYLYRLYPWFVSMIFPFFLSRISIANLGSYSSVAGATLPTQCTNCNAGTWSSMSGATSRTSCLGCSRGTFSSIRGASSISQCLSCNIGT